jgi:oligopeptide/dipeptide ABC transporter ATP-binding protein
MLDVSIRAGIIKLLLDMQREAGMSYLFITHDLSLAWMICNRIAVMYLGKIVEIGLPDAIIHHPRHPCTKALASVIPVPDPSAARRKIILEGDIPNPVYIPVGCRFYSRCYMHGHECREVSPELRKCAPDHWIACLKV